MLLIRRLLPAFISCLAIHAAASASTEAGLIGPQNAMLMLNGFHFISGAPDHYLQANHHCALMNGTVFDAFIQCVLYIPGTNPARLAGIEYIVSGDAFATFPMEERQLWHSHQFEVSSGYLIEPGMPANVDKEIMKILVNSYGKTVHTWRYDQKNETLPFGIPELVNGYTGHGQLPADFVEERDEYWGVNTTEIRQSRKDIPVPAVEPGADAWKQGIILTLGLVNHTSNATFEP